MSFSFDVAREKSERTKEHATRTAGDVSPRLGEGERDRKETFFRLKNKSKSRRSLIIKSDSRENKRKPPTHFSCSIFASCNLTTAFVQCDPQSMPYFSCSNALFFVLDASTAVVPKDDERRTMRDTVARHIVLLERGIFTREELFCFFFFFTTTKKISSSLLLQSVQKVGGVSLSRSKSALLSWWGFVFTRIKRERREYSFFSEEGGDWIGDVIQKKGGA